MMLCAVLRVRRAHGEHYRLPGGVMHQTTECINGSGWWAGPGSSSRYVTRTGARKRDHGHAPSQWVTNCLGDGNERLTVAEPVIVGERTNAPSASVDREWLRKCDYFSESSLRPVM